MAVTTLRPSINIRNQFSFIRSGLQSATKTAVGLRQILFKKTKVKREAIINDQKLFNKRRENIKRKGSEDLLEANQVGGIVGGVGTVVQSSTKGFLGRIMDAIGSFIIGWLAYNLPNIITMAENLISRVKTAGQILKRFVTNIVKIFTGSAKVFNAILTNFVNFDIFDTSKRVESSFDDLNKTFGELQTGIEDGINLVTTPLGQMPGEVSAEFGDRQTMPAEQVGAGTRTGTVTTTGPETSGGKVNPQAVYSYIRSKGVSHTHTMGILANIKGESDFEIGVQEKGNSKAGVGLFQYTFPSRKQAFLRSVPDYKTNWKGQIDFAINKDENTPLYLRKQFSSPEEAADDFMRNWENPSKSVYPERRRKHNQFIKSFNPSNATSSKITSTPSSPPPPINPRQTYSKGQNIKGQIATKGVSYAEVTSLRGRRGSGWHGGVDIAAPTGTYIALRVDCEVVASGSYGNYGLLIDVWIPQYGIQLRFAHNSALIIRSGKIPAGTSFARVGSTGRSTGPHIHLEADTRKGSAAGGGNVDPSRFIPLILLTESVNKSAVSAPTISGVTQQQNIISSAQIATQKPGQKVTTTSIKSPQVTIINDIPQQPMQVSQDVNVQPSLILSPTPDKSSILNSLIKNHLLLDLSYT